jgi:hypothetical protein
MEGESADRARVTLGPAPADARPHARWPAWRVVIAYALLAALAGISIWYIDLKAHGPGAGDAVPQATPR